MKLLGEIQTPWTPYAVTFSNDGQRLAIGGGTFFAEGGLILTDLQSGETAVMSTADLLPGADDSDATISSLCFADGDGLLAASTWGLRWGYRPPLLLAADGLQAQCLHAFSDSPDGRWWRRPCATGVLLSGARLISRLHNPLGGRLIEISTRAPEQDSRDVLSISTVPGRAFVANDRHRQRLTHHRVIVSRGHAITETGGSRGTVVANDKGEYQRPLPREGLVARSLTDGSDSYITVHGSRRVTAICSLAADLQFVTGGRDGELDMWTWDGCWRQERVQDAQPVQPADRRHWGRIVWVTYTPSSIVALVGLPRPGTWVSLTAGGELARWRERRLEHIWQLPVAGSPRALAVHPTRPLVAVGVKQGLQNSWISTVCLVDVG